jgi:hypothetical protein
MPHAGRILQIAEQPPRAEFADAIDYDGPSQHGNVQSKVAAITDVVPSHAH